MREAGAAADRWREAAASWTPGRPVLLRGGRVLDPAAGRDEVADLLVGERVEAVGRGLGRPDGALEVPCEGLIVTPGWIDAHVHLRDPGQTHKEDLNSGTRAALNGGFTTVCCMPNTTPVLDDVPQLRDLTLRADRLGRCSVHPIGAVTVGQAGETLAPLGELAAAGAVAFSDDGHPVASAGLMQAALILARELARPVIQHAEDRTLSAGGAMHLGPVAHRLGVPGIPASSEEVVVARDLILARRTGGHLHVAHVSSAGTVAQLRRAREQGLSVTAEVTPHHLLLTDAALEEAPYDTRFKMNPPLRGEADRQALLEALADGTIGIVATDHAPHHRDEKELPFEEAAFGIVGLETALPLLWSLVEAGELAATRLVEAVTAAPASLFGFGDRGTLAPGKRGDITVIAPGVEETIRASTFASRSRNTPFDGWPVAARCLGGLCQGRMFCNNIQESV